jgi:aspartate racemase
MGPLATCDLLNKIIMMTDAKSDQEHIHVCIDVNTRIPDRTAAILHKGADPVQELVKSGIRLQSMGAEALAMSCNTAHFFYDRMIPFFDVPVLHMIKETARRANQMGMQKVGVLATDGTLRSGIYQKALSEEGIRYAVPPERHQKQVMALIYEGIKAGGVTDIGGFYEALEELFAQGAEALILGCTELPIAFQRYRIDKPCIDPTSVLAAAIIEFAGMPVLKRYQ